MSGFYNTAYDNSLYTSMIKTIHLRASVPEELAGQRLDRVLAILSPEHSRARLQAWLRQGDVHINQGIMDQRQRVKGGEQIVINTTFATEEAWEGENIPLQIVHEDDTLLVLNKPPGMVVHPGAGNPRHTL